MSPEKKYLNALKHVFQLHEDKHYAHAMSKYMRFKFEYLGLKSPLRKILQKDIIDQASKDASLDIEKFAMLLWDEEYREYQYTAIEFLEKTKKRWDSKIIFLLESLLKEKQWWDTIDGLSANMIGHYYSGKIKDTINKIPEWRDDSNFWMNRVCIIYQLKYKQKTDVQLLHSLILQHIESKEFFIQKAIGWSLREYAKTNAEWVINFVKQNEKELSSLSKREALKHQP